MAKYIPAYVRTKKMGLLKGKIRRAAALLSSCTLCPRHCEINRNKGEKGFCQTGERAIVSSWAPHYGEEAQLVGDKGSGTIFFSQCSLKCKFCQNYEISVLGRGQKADEGQIASIMLELANTGCHNINLVTPSHVVPQVLKAVDLAAARGLNIPLVYNCSGYESKDTLSLLEGVIDIYMPDFKFWDPESARICCNAADYPKMAKMAVRQMHDQVGDLTVDKDGVACSGLLVRHLVMPGALDETRSILKFLKGEISPHIHVNLMSQYRPMGEAFKDDSLCRPIRVKEYREALNIAKNLDLNLV